LLIYETDDLVFDPRMAPHWAPFDAMPEAERRLTAHGMWRNGQALRRCDAVSVATEPLAQFARQVHPRVFVSPNVVNRTLIAQADATLEASRVWRVGDPVTLAYMSGTATHNRDFAHAADAVRRALETYPNTRLLVVGPLDLPEDFRVFGERVQRLSLVPPEAVPALLAQASINLAPLEPNNLFTSAKSCVKYVEAGLLGIPTIASPCHDFARAIADGDNGGLADSSDAWFDALAALIESPELRAQIGARARADVLARHTTAARGQQLAAQIDMLGTECAGPPS
jgi:glycosyltransferase involved in cell wall biosynthesis